MTLDKAVMAFAGIIILASLTLGHFVNPLWYWLTAFAGANLFQAAFTGFCPAAMIFKKLGVRPGISFK